jgi:hypothetical protein
MDTAVTSRHAPTAAKIVNILLGVWLAVSPFVLRFSRNSALWNNIVLGIALVLVAFVSEWGDGALQGLVVPLGIWIFASPFVLGFSKAAFLANNVSMAFAVIAAGAIADGLRLPESYESHVGQNKSESERTTQ